MLSYSKSCLIGAILETLAYGLYLSYFLQGIQIILSQRKRQGGPSIRLLLTSLVLFFLITVRMVLDNKAVVEAFTNDPITPHAADIYLQSFGNGAMFRTGTYVALTIVADLFIVYRVHAIWAGDLVVSALPALLAIADIVTGALFIQAIRELAAGSSPDGKNAATHATVFYSFTLALNVICTLLIALRIYVTKRRLEGLTMVALLNVGTTMTILIESAALYSVCLIAMIVPTVLGNNVQYCVLSVMPGIVGIAFSLIIVRIGSGLSPESSAGPASEIQFARTKASTQLDLSDLPTNEDGPGRQIAVNVMSRSRRQSQSGASRSDMGYDSERTKNEHELEETGV
ncbi:hypothetical protein C8R45DRAFT_1113122 [Mycena sanguinolenta]|nr:hypothetical protein C8R45DRAFT_1113122 [Mycena sanguinolenta]